MSRVAVLAKSVTGLAHRTTSSVAVSQSEGSARSAWRSSGRSTDEEEQVELKLREPHGGTVVVHDLGRREEAPHVVGGCRPLVGAERSRVLVQLERGRVAIRFGEARRGITRAHEHVRETEHVVAVGFGDSDDVADELHRQAVRDVAHEVDITVALGDGIEDLVDAVAHLFVEAGDHPRREAGRDQLSQTRGAVVSGEPLRVAAHLLDLGMADHDPEVHSLRCAFQRDLRMAQHGAASAQVGEHLVGKAVRVETAVGEVDVEDRRHEKSEPPSTLMFAPVM